MAVGECKSELLEDSSGNECWPGGSCNIKTTAQAIFALSNVNSNTDDAEEWLLSKEISPRDMKWYLQIESSEQTSCVVSYAGSSYNLEISEDKTLNSGAGSCLRLAQENYWLEISSTSPGCYDNEYEISCDKDFFTTKLFKKSTSPTIYVGETHSSAGGTTIEKINSFCFSTASSCDYEASLWAAFVLDSLDYEASSYLPYLITLAEDNKKYIPESFLYLLTSDTDYRTSLLLKQKANKYWQGVVGNDKFYDTALALYPFQYEDPQEKTNAKKWLLEEAQEESGCWNSGSIRDTAFVLHSVWPGALSAADDNGGIDGVLDCGTSGYYCMSRMSCQEVGGSILSEYDCSAPYRCCDTPKTQETCLALGGEICISGERCTGTTDDSSDLLFGETCCLGGTCQETTSETECEISGGSCSAFGCDENEEESSVYSCESGDYCCFEKTPGKSTVWIWILTILIVLVVLGIIFKDTLRRFWFRTKSGVGGRKRPRPGGYLSPAPLTGRPERMPMLGRALPPPPKRHLKRQPPRGDIDDVLKKLRDMGK